MHEFERVKDEETKNLNRAGLRPARFKLMISLEEEFNSQENYGVHHRKYRRQEALLKAVNFWRGFNYKISVDYICPVLLKIMLEFNSGIRKWNKREKMKLHGAERFEILHLPVGTGKKC